MPLPPQLRDAIADEVAGVDRRALTRAAEQLSERYRAGRSSGAVSGPADRAAYLAARLPATYAAGVAVFRELARRITSPMRSLLDLGAGPGTALWAAAEILPSVERFSALEGEEDWIEVGRRLASRHPVLRSTMWQHADLRRSPASAAHDVVVLSYAMGEIPDPQTMVRWAWALTDKVMVIVEPGTPKAFANVLRARELLIDLGAQMAAPCPHHNACPLAERNDWCHFSVRLERSSEHRRLKGGELGYEDEKFSYLIASKVEARAAEARIVRHPLKHSGHVKLTLCTPPGLQTPTVSKSQREAYRAARQAEWGDEWPLTSHFGN